MTSSLDENDVLYTCLPYAIMLNAWPGHCLFHGCTAVVSRKLPVYRWSTVQIQKYVYSTAGELARYLLNSKPTPFDTKHNLRMRCNGCSEY